MIHELKTWPVPFEAIRSGRKTFEYRKDDRGFKECDVLQLNEWAPPPTHGPRPGYTGRVIFAQVGYVVRGPDFGVPEGFVVMSLTGVVWTHNA